ncbi:uncharacterized protein AB675_4823 [Cyphellophora attinorum]|uniref:Uncharacterized protein n=1 Tax=Cyphellophora attinorum TaxID=1664694 RepID=A0A0N1GY71_9EURO|nr:uncharacterized protein AB675_4823 [Phialophora attinorum]KPI35577.1 hypothetical protein AB675_4823 [Phialophora attinorum]
MNAEELHRWNQEVEQQASEAGLGQTLAANHLMQPPGFVSLRIIYTMLSAPGGHASLSEGDAHSTRQHGVYQPRLTAQDRKHLDEDPHASQRYPVLRLLDAFVLRHMDQSGSADLPIEQPVQIHHQNTTAASLSSICDFQQPVPSQGLPSNPIGSFHCISDIQQHPNDLFTSLNLEKVPSRSNNAPAGGSDSIPSFDDYELALDAPFLDYMDTLDEQAT